VSHWLALAHDPSWMKGKKRVDLGLKMGKEEERHRHAANWFAWLVRASVGCCEVPKSEQGKRLGRKQGGVFFHCPVPQSI